MGDSLEELAARMGGASTPSHEKGHRPPPPPRAKAKAKAADEGDNRASEGGVVRQQRADTAPVTADTTSPSSTALAPRAQAGDLVQVRVQPRELGNWFNQLLDAGEFAFDARRGDIAGAVLLVAQHHAEEIHALLELWAGTPGEAMKKMLWDTYKQSQAERPPHVVEGERE